MPIPEENDALVLASKAKEGRGAKELKPRLVSKEERQAFEGSDAKELSAWQNKDAFEELGEKETAKVWSHVTG